MRQRLFLSVLATLLFPHVLGCTETAEQTPRADSREESEAAAAAKRAVCDWTEDFDALVVGRVTAVRLTAEPCLQQGNGQLLDSPPEGSEVAQALEVDLEVTGTLAGHAPRV